MKKIQSLFLLALLVGGLFSCEEILETPLQGGDLTEDEALQSKQDVYALLQSCYDVTANVYNGRIQYLGELLGDNLVEPTVNEDLTEVYNHNTLFFNGTIGGIYGDPYITAFRCNRIIEVLDQFDFTVQEKEQIEAEARFLRAISLWEVVRLFAHPPGFTTDNSHPGIVYKTDTESEVVPRESVASNYQNIIDDLNWALTRLPASADFYASQDAVNGFLAKIHFQLGEYALAADYATAVISTNRYSLGTSIDRFENDTVDVAEIVFSNTSRPDFNDFRSGGFSNYRSDVAANPLFKASMDFYNTYNDTNDLRFTSFFELDESGDEPLVLITKFNQEWFNVPIIHLTDLKLLRAEALALSGGDLTVARQDVNDIRERAYGSSDRNLSSSAGASQVVEAARFERRIEMFGEGDRIQQLKRRGAIESELIEVRDHPWNCPGMIIQFPISEQTELFELNPTGGC